MEIRITPVELYFLGTLLHAKYIDYAYIAAMDDIHENYQLIQHECYSQLGKKGILNEDFSGNIELSDDAKKLLMPLFFAEKETSLDICSIGDDTQVSVFKFHFLNEAITMVYGDSRQLCLKDVDVNDIENIVGSIIPQNYSISDTPKITHLDSEKVSGLIAVKAGHLNGHNEVYICIKIDEVLYHEEQDNILSPVSKDSLVTVLGRILKGVK